MALVYSIVASGRTREEKDIVRMFREKAPFKINTGSGPFRVFITELSISAEKDGFFYKGTVSDSIVSGFYDPLRKRGTITFNQSMVKVEEVPGGQRVS